MSNRIADDVILNSKLLETLSYELGISPMFTLLKNTETNRELLYLFKSSWEYYDYLVFTVSDEVFIITQCWPGKTIGVCEGKLYLRELLIDNDISYLCTYKKKENSYKITPITDKIVQIYAKKLPNIKIHNASEIYKEVIDYLKVKIC